MEGAGFEPAVGANPRRFSSFNLVMLGSAAMRRKARFRSVFSVRFVCVMLPLLANYEKFVCNMFAVLSLARFME